MAAKLLIVDDSATDRLIIKNMLSHYDVLTACDGQEALRVIDEQKDIDLIILDLNMPVMDGFEVLKALRAMDSNKRMRTIILTNYDELDKEIRGLQEGAVDFIRKPVNMESLRVRTSIHLELLRIQRLYERALTQSRSTLNALLDQAPIGIVLSRGDRPSNNPEDQDIFNATYERIAGRSREELVTLGWESITHPEDLAREMVFYRRYHAGEIDTYSIEKRFIRPDGSFVWVDMIVSRLPPIDDMPYSHICLVQDITERKSVEGALRESERSKSVLLANLPGMAYRCDYDENWTMRLVSEGCYDLTGYRAENLVNNRDLSFNDLILPKYREELFAEWARMLAQGKPFKYEYEITAASGQQKWVLEMGQGVTDESGKVVALEGIIIDITDRKEQELRLKQISQIDSLTGLYNRRYLESIMAEEAAQGQEGPRAVVLLRLRKIHSISLAYGYHFSEEIVKELAGALKGLATQSRQLYQISFERFAFYFTRYDGKEELEKFCQELIRLVDGMQIFRAIGCGIGVMTIDCNNCLSEHIIRNASTAAERADRHQVYGYRFFDSEMEASVLRETKVKEALFQLVDGKPGQRLYLQYQPILNLRTNRVEEFEALARIQSDTLGFLSPMEFIPVSEETQLIIPMGKRVLEIACTFYKRLEALGYGNVRICVNVSAVQLLRSDFLEDFTGVLAEMGVRPQSIGLEITESVFMDNHRALNEKLEKLMNIGVMTMLDDFGTGYSSLARERDIKINRLKMDKSFVDSLLQRPEHAITRDIIAMAHRVGHTVVAEGVETPEQMRYLLDSDCDMIQGYLYSKPLDEDAAIAFLERSGQVR
ncbi:MAG: EAL domain-containing protein [Clostridiales bacterium]|nr:EAL domain-containing protein [Clostridiales bacterium]